MRKKTVSMMFAGLTALSGILPHAPKIIPEGALLSAAAVAVVLSGPPKCEAANASGNGAMTSIQCAAAMKDLQQQSASLSQQLRSCKTNAVCAPVGVRLNRITQQLLSLKRKCSPALPAGASTAPVKEPASAPSGAGGIDLKDASGEVLNLKASWPDIPEFGSADSLSASMDTALLPQKAQAAGDGLPICPRNGAVFCPGNLPCPEKQKCVSDIPFPEEGWLNDCMANVCGSSDDGGGDCGPYDIEKSCCINKKVVDKFKTPDKTLQWAGVIPDCKSRVQAVSEKVVRPEKKGCSVTSQAANLINLKERRFSKDERRRAQPRSATPCLKTSAGVL